MEVPEALIDKLKCPCETVQKQGEEIKETRELMIESSTSLKNLSSEMQELKEDVKEMN